MLQRYLSSFLCWSTLTFLLLLFIKRRRIFEKKYFFKILLSSYLIGLLSLTLFPYIDFGVENNTNLPYLHVRFRSKNLSSINIIPLKTIIAQLTGNIPELGTEDRISIGLMNLLGNIFLYFPVGFLLPLACERKIRINNVMTFVLLFSFTTEILQYFTGRSADIDDIVLHLIGVACGYGLWYGFTSLAKKCTS